MLKEKKNPKWHIGMRVAVLKANAGKKDDKKFLGYGVIDGTKRIKISRYDWHEVPRIKFDKPIKNLINIFGYECWWMPEKDYNRMVCRLPPPDKSGGFRRVA